MSWPENCDVSSQYPNMGKLETITSITEPYVINKEGLDELHDLQGDEQRDGDEVIV